MWKIQQGNNLQSRQLSARRRNKSLVDKSDIPKSPVLAHEFLAHNAMGQLLPLDSIDLLGTVLPLLHQLGKV